MNIFENKNHRGMIYNGQRPVRVVQDPGDPHGLDKSYGGMNRPWYDRIDVHHVPDAMARVFPGNPGPETEKLGQGWLPAGHKPRDLTERTPHEKLGIPGVIPRPDVKGQD